MNVFTFCAAALFCVCGIAILRSVKSEIVPYAVTGAGIVLSVVAFSQLTAIKELISQIEATGNVSVFVPIVKALTVALLCQFTAEACRDFGESSIASKVEFGGKVVIIYLSIPLIKEVLSSATQML